MKTYCRNLQITKEHIMGAYDEWLHSSSGKKNSWHIVKDYGCPEALINEIYYQIKSNTLAFIPIKYFDRVEPINGKIRKLGVQSCKQQICDYLAVMLLKPIFNAHIGYWQCASIPGKGQVFASKALRKWVPKCKYFIKFDIKKYYPTVDQKIVKKNLRKYVGSNDLLNLCYSLLNSYGRGLNIGSYFSQYIGNWHLSFLYRELEQLHKRRRDKKIKLVNHQLFYMDDICILGNSKKDLKVAAKFISNYVSETLGQLIKPWKVCVSDSEPLDMVGYVHYRDHTIIRSSTFKRGKRAFSRMKTKPCLKRAQRCISYYGFFYHSDSNKFIQKYHVREIVNQSKEMISNVTRQVQCIQGSIR